MVARGRLIESGSFRMTKSPIVTLDEPEIRDLVLTHTGLARALAWQVHQRLPKYIDLEDIIGYANLGLVRAAKRFDPGRGVSFVTFAHPLIKGAILDAIKGSSWFDRADFGASRYRDLEDRERAIVDVSKTDALRGQCGWLRRLSARLAVQTLLTCGTSPERGPAESAEFYELRGRLAPFIEGLPADARSLVLDVYAHGKSITQAGDALGISRSWACRLHARALDLLARRVAESNLSGAAR
jgi:RNA polymerase sigma factor for flagellar operon FliA